MPKKLLAVHVRRADSVGLFHETEWELFFAKPKLLLSWRHNLAAQMLLESLDCTEHFDWHHPNSGV